MMMTRTRTTTTVFTNSRSKRSERIIIKRLRFRRRAKVEEDKEEVFDEIPVLSGERFLQLHREKSTPDDDDENCLQLAMYSSHVRAITTDSESFVTTTGFIAGTRCSTRFLSTRRRERFKTWITIWTDCKRARRWRF